MTTDRALLKHFLASLAYRTQKAVRGAPESFADYRVASGVRTPQELIRHMSGVLSYALSRFTGDRSRIEPLATWPEEITRFHEILNALGAHLDNHGDSVPADISTADKWPAADLPPEPTSEPE